MASTATAPEIQSYTMSLAAGIRKRDVRKLKARSYSVPRVLDYINSLLASGMKTGKVRKILSDMQRRGQLPGYMFSTDTKESVSTPMFLMILPSHLSLGFDVCLFLLKHRYFRVSMLPVRITDHAIDRIIFRDSNVTTLLGAVQELAHGITDITMVSRGIHQDAIVTQDISVRTPNGFLIMNRDRDQETRDTGGFRAAISTWCHHSQQKSCQTIISSPIEYLRTQSSLQGVSPVAYLMRICRLEEPEAQHMYDVAFRKSEEYRTGLIPSVGRATPIAPIATYI